jgi:hypothetical protein
VTARSATGFRLLFARVQRLHTIGPKSRENREIAHGLHACEMGNLLNLMTFPWE